jgi:hypothetical protein
LVKYELCSIFPKSQISTQKQDTGAIMLKTTLVRVSCIQDTKIRGKTTAKVFGKVDSFWAYQYSREARPPCLAEDDVERQEATHSKSWQVSFLVVAVDF